MSLSRVPGWSDDQETVNMWLLNASALDPKISTKQRLAWLWQQDGRVPADVQRAYSRLSDAKKQAVVKYANWISRETTV